MVLTGLFPDLYLITIATEKGKIPLYMTEKLQMISFLVPKAPKRKDLVEQILECGTSLAIVQETLNAFFPACVGAEQDQKEEVRRGNTMIIAKTLIFLTQHSPSISCRGINRSGKHL